MTRLRAPKADGAILVDPPFAEVPELLRDNLARLDRWDHDFQGRAFRVLRDKARSDAFEVARRYHAEAGIDWPGSGPIDPAVPVVATGHQPELFHPGVWVKNFAVSGLAERVGGIALNLIVDVDIPKGPSIRVPSRHPGGPTRVVRVPFDTWAGEAPYEDQPIADRGLFATFPDRVRQVLAGSVASPLIDRYWAQIATAPVGMPSGDRVGRQFARARRLVEADWGVRNLEAPLGEVCETDGFRWFACHVLAHLARFRAIHNDALEAHRAAHKIRSVNHPVAALRAEGDWLEAPFWAWRVSAPRRRPLMVRQGCRSMDLRIAGEDAPFVTLPLAEDREACCAVEMLGELAGAGIRIRTRALTTTMFARLLLGDLFLHGIGGAKYDELGDVITARFFGIEPPGFVTLSMTLHLGLPTTPTIPSDLVAAGRIVRDLRWQPERSLDPSDPGIARLISAKRAAVAVDPPRGDPTGRLDRFRKLRAINDALAGRTASRLPEAEAEYRSIADQIHSNRLARSREYASILFGEDRIRAEMDRVRSLTPIS